MSELDAGLRRTGVLGIALGALALIACELPVILAVVGLGGLSAGAMAMRPSAAVEVAGIVLATIGVALLIVRALRRRWL